MATVTLKTYREINMETLILTRRRGIKITAAEICVRKIDSEEAALRAYPNIRGYERFEFEEKKQVRYYSPAAVKWYNSRKVMDSFKTIYLDD